MEIKKMLLYLSLAFIIQSAGCESALAVKRINNELCLCSNATYSSVTDVLDIDKANLERLVVYFYKDVTTAEVLMFIPKKDKQLLFPDLDIDIDDDLSTITNETINEVLTPNPSFVSVNAYKEHNGMDESEVPIKLIDDDNEDSSSIGFHEGIIETAKLPPQDGDVDLESDSIGIESSGIPPSTGTLSIDSDIGREQEDDENLSFKPESPTDDHISPQNDLSINNEYTWTSENEENSSQYKPNKPSSESGLQLKDVDINGESYKVNKPSDGIMNFQNTIFENGFQDEELNGQNLGLSKLFGYVTFDTWFNQQMRSINHTGQTPISSLNIETLKTLVERTLYRNNMYVRKDGVLIDSYGKVLDLANLKLRPILIGNSVTYDSLLDVTDKYILPTDKPYLEAVLVTLVYPPNILDVIPLGKSYVSRASYKKSYNYWNQYSQPQHQLSSKSLNCASGKCNVWDSKVSKDKDKDFSRKHRSHRLKDTLPSTLRFNTYPSQYGRQASNLRNRKVKLNQNIKTTDTRTKVLSNILKALGSLINSGKNGKVRPTQYKKIVKAPNINNRYFKGDLDDDIDYLHEDGKPWFRIIGGNAATSSGTPVSSRGRSGNLLDDYDA